MLRPITQLLSSGDRGLAEIHDWIDMTNADLAEFDKVL